MSAGELVVVVVVTVCRGDILAATNRGAENSLQQMGTLFEI